MPTKREVRPATSLSAVIRQIEQGMDPLTAVALFAKHVKAREDAAWLRREEWTQRESPVAQRQASVAYGHTECLAEILGSQDDLKATLKKLAVPGFTTL